MTTTGVISAAELTARSRDRSYWVANNILEDFTAIASWRVSVGVWSAGADISDPNHPTSCAYDRDTIATTQPISQGGSTSTYSIIFQLRQGTDGPHTADFLMVMGHNFATLNPPLTVRIDLADDNAFSSNVIILYLTTSSGAWPSQRIYAENINSFARYTSIQYARMIISSSNGAGLGGVPAFSELILGRRRQLWYLEDTPWEDRASETERGVFIARSGRRKGYVKSRGGRSWNMTLRSGGMGESYSQRSELISMFEEASWGTRPLVYMPHPATIQTPYYGHFDPPKLFIPRIGEIEREAKFHFVETTPFWQLEDLPSYPV